MKTRTLWCTIFILVYSLLLGKSTPSKNSNIIINAFRDINVSFVKKEKISSREKLIKERINSSLKTPRIRDNLVFGYYGDYINIDTILTKYKPSIYPDFAHGMSNTKEYFADLNNLIDWDSDHNRYKQIKGYTRNYFTADDGGRIRLTKKIYNSSAHNEEDCLWYIDNVCINIDNPNSKLFFKGSSGAYKIDAVKNDTLLLSFTAVFIETPEVIFKPNSTYDGEYGFDDNRFDKVAKLNEAQYLDKKSKYLIPFMSMLTGQTATIEAQVTYDKRKFNNEDLNNTEVQFRSSSKYLTIAKHNDTVKEHSNIFKYKLADFKNGIVELDIKSEEVLKDAYIEAKIEEKIIGRINIHINNSLKPSNLILTQIVVNNKLGMSIDLDIEKQRIENLLNKKSFNQTFTQWNIIRTDTLYLQINKDNITLHDIFSEAVNHYVKNGLKPAKTAIMFLSDSDIAWDANGYGHFTKNDKYKYTIIHTKAVHGKTPIHELGHNHELPEMASTFKEYFYDTENFMDYYSVHNNDTRKMFFKHQWEKIYNVVKADLD